MDRQSLIHYLFTVALHTACIGRVSYICPKQKLMHKTYNNNNVFEDYEFAPADTTDFSPPSEEDAANAPPEQMSLELSP